MLAPKVAKAQTKAAENPTSKMAPHSSGRDQRTIGNQATLRPLGRQTSRTAVSNPPRDYEQRDGSTENTMTEETSRGASWNFSQIPLFPPDRASRSQGSSPS